MRSHYILFLFLSLLIVSCGGRVETVVVTAVPTANIPDANGEPASNSSLPPTFTPEAIVIETATPITPAPTRTPASATAVPEFIIPTALPDALPILLAAEQNLRGLISFSHERSITVDTPAFSQTEDISCIFQAPDQAFCHAYRETLPITGDPTVRDFEFVQRGDQLWARGNSNAAWEVLPSDNINYLESYSNQFIFSPFVTEAYVFGESAIDDVAVFEIRLTLEPVAAVNALYSGENFEEFLEQAQDGEATATVWVGQEDGLMRLITIEIIFDSALGEVSLNGLGTLANFNQPAVIPEP